AYNVSKYGVIGLTEAIAVEGKEHGISAICLSPGAVDTEMLRRANPALRPGLTPGDVAELIVALLDSRLAPASGANIPLFSNAYDGASAPGKRPQVGALVGEHGRSRLGPGSYQAGAGRHLAVDVQLGITAAVQADGGPHCPARQVEADQLALRHAAADHELIPRGGVADVLDLVLVLIGPEAVQVVVGGRGAEHGPGRAGALLLRVVVVLNPDPPEQRVEVVRHVTGGVHPGCAGLAELVGEDPVLLRDRDGRDAGLDADAHHGEIARDAVAVGGHDRFQALGALEGGDPASGQQLDAVRAVDGAHQRADLATQHRLQRRPARKDRGHPDSELGQRGRYLGPDESHADDDRVPARQGFLLDRVAFGHRAQV